MYLFFMTIMVLINVIGFTFGMVTGDQELYRHHMEVFAAYNAAWLVWMLIKNQPPVDKNN